MRGFGFEFDIEKGTTRSWYIDANNIKRWADDDSEYVSVQRQDLKQNEQE